MHRAEEAADVHVPAQRARSNVMKDYHKLAWFDSENIDPDIIRTKCEYFRPMRHYRHHRGTSFVLFNERE